VLVNVESITVQVRSAWVKGNCAEPSLSQRGKMVWTVLGIALDDELYTTQCWIRSTADQY
jgi:hypothetical protein